MVQGRRPMGSPRQRFPRYVNPAQTIILKCD